MNPEAVKFVEQLRDEALSGHGSSDPRLLPDVFERDKLRALKDEMSSRRE